MAEKLKFTKLNQDCVGGNFDVPEFQIFEFSKHLAQCSDSGDSMLVVFVEHTSYNNENLHYQALCKLLLRAYVALANKKQ
jgi:hypothetical protein